LNDDEEYEEGIDDDIGHPDSAVPPSDPVARREYGRRRDRVRIEALEADAFWTMVLGSEVGRREMWRIIAGSAACHAFETRFACGPNGFPDDRAAWYGRGEQDMGLRLYHEWMRRDPAAIALMHQENDVRFIKPRGRRRRAANG
jgi:hypothetical protein